MEWLDEGELRIGLGCMRLATAEDRAQERAAATVAAAVDAGITVFDTARAYGHGDSERGLGERWLAAAVRRSGAAERARILTKGGMTRPAGAWVPDGRARAIAADCEASLEALGGLPIDLYLLHAPDPRTPWRTTARALARLSEQRLVRRVGLSNVNRRQLDEAAELAPIAAVQVGLSVLDDRAVRGGVLERCQELGIALIAHSPLGGPRRVGGLRRREALAALAAQRGCTPAELALAWLLALSPAVVAIPGATRPDSARSAARAAGIALSPAERERIAGGPPRRTAASSWRRPAERAPAAERPPLAERPPPAERPRPAEVVLVMGIPGAGKTRLAERYVADGYVRLNRDERGGGLRELAAELDARLAAGARRVVLDNTWLSRAARSYAIDAARRHGARVRCAWLDTPLAQAQVNLVLRLLEACGELPGPERLRALARVQPGLMAPTSQMRTVRELEPPSEDEGLAAVEVVPFTREPPPGRTGAGVAIGAAALERDGWQQHVRALGAGERVLVFDWRPGGSGEELAPAAGRLAAVAGRPVESAVCPHGVGPPVCWCRPPLPGLPLAFAHRHAIDPAQLAVLGVSTTHRTLAATLGARFVSP